MGIWCNRIGLKRTKNILKFKEGNGTVEFGVTVQKISNWKKNEYERIYFLY